MQVVFKYPIEITDTFSLMLPKNAQLLSVQFQHDTLCLWVLVNRSQPEEERRFRLAGTGHPILQSEEQLKFIGTCQLSASFVVHLFEIVA